MALSRQKFTFERLRRFELTKRNAREFLWDSDVTMRACRATTGKKAFIFKHVFLGKTLRITISSIHDCKFDDARTEARRLQTLIDTGSDYPCTTCFSQLPVGAGFSCSRLRSACFSCARRRFRFVLRITASLPVCSRPI